jgi:hypothetical protein
VKEDGSRKRMLERNVEREGEEGEGRDGGRNEGGMFLVISKK